VPPPSDADVAHVLTIVCTRVGRLLARDHLEPEDESAPADPLTRVTPETVDGMSMAKIEAIIDALRQERYQWTPVRRVYIANTPRRNARWDS